MRRTLSALALAALIGAGALGFWRHLDRQMEQPSAASEPIRFEVLSGESLRSILARLQQQGAVRHPREVQWYLRLHGLHPRAQAGHYESRTPALVKCSINW